MDNLLHITVAAAPDKSYDSPSMLSHEIRMTKASILYGDKVTLYGTTTPLIRKLSTLDNSSSSIVEKAHAYNVALSVFSDLGILNESYVKMHQVWAQDTKLLSKNPLMLTKSEAKARARFEKAVPKLWSDLRNSILRNQEVFALNELEVAVDEGLLSIVDLPGADEPPNYLGSLEGILNSPSTLPMFDESISRVIGSALASGKFDLETHANGRANQAALMARLLELLPVFGIPMDELLDLRKDLSRAVIPFRAEISKLSGEIETTSWDADIHYDINKIYQERIAPILGEIQDNLESLKVINFIPRRVSEKSTAFWGSIGAGASIGVSISPLAGILTAIVGTGFATQAAFAELKERYQGVQRNGLYFYYQIGREAAKRKRKKKPRWKRT